MATDQGILKIIHKKQQDMIGVLERFEELSLDAEYSRDASGNQKISCLFGSLQGCIDQHLKFETDYLLPLLNQDASSQTLTGLLQQRELILSLIAKMHRLMARTHNESFGVGAWDEFIDSALSLIRATFSLFHWEEREFLYRISEAA